MMMINRRRACGGKKLPYDAEIEYLESSGTQWIDTGIFYKSGDVEEVNLKFEFTEINTSDNNILFGAFSSTGLSRLFTFVGSDRIWKTTYGGVISSNTIAETNKEYIVHLYFRNAKQDLVVNGTDIINSTTVSSNIPPVSQSVFCSKYTNGIISPSKIKLKSFDMSLNGVIVCDLIPVRAGSTGYMLDKLTGRLYGNSGTGDFILGPDK